ncbi:hypothetical protein A0H81_01750 [Grifola frondosa]|uniref:Uncharacterized protein n=1 Tax=Grifola frondosa TaxID=5627 RepID=A0A1C7MN05_GRIFR|nr:hypothetical protein A0H81_01750 [Grifola frondosa]
MSSSTAPHARDAYNAGESPSPAICARCARDHRTARTQVEDTHLQRIRLHRKITYSKMRTMQVANGGYLSRSLRSAQS